MQVHHHLQCASLGTPLARATEAGKELRIIGRWFVTDLTKSTSRLFSVRCRDHRPWHAHQAAAAVARPTVAATVAVSLEVLVVMAVENRIYNC